MRPFTILFFACLSFTAGAAGFSMASVIKQAEIIKVNAVTAATNTAITVSTTIKGFAANDPYNIKSVDVPKATFMSHVKGNVGSLVKKNAWYAAWLASMAAAGWAINELTNQVMAPVSTHRGRCTTNYGTLGTNKTVAECNALQASAWAGSYGPVTMSSYFTSINGNPVYIYDLKINATGQVMGRMGYLEALSAFTGTPEPISDNNLYDSLISFMLQDPTKAAQAFMVPDAWPYPYPEIFPDTVPYIPGVTQSDQELLDLYAQGLLQSNNPNAAHYVSPQKLAEIAALAGQLQQGVTPQALVDAANEALTAPISQAQLEETIKKQEAAAAKADAAAVTQAATALAPAATALDKLNDEKADLEGMITDAPTAQPPSTMPNIFKWTLPTGNCQPYPFRFTIQAGSAQADDNGAFCQTYNEVAHPLIFWFLNMLTAIYIFSIWSRTMTSVVGGR
ncbi:hypothetical protein [Aeromonas rivipollensis]|uniref:hypothetical protein n=1 Tax=Aeromonas rivipollensis TaxID=948519 RepID=UPI0038D04975